MAMRRQLAVASPPSKSFVRAHHTQILGGFVVGSLTVLMVAMLYYLIKKKLVPALRQRQSLHEPGQKGNLKEEKIMLRSFQLDELVKATKNFTSECLLGSGAFANVYKGTFDDAGTLAIKRTHANSFQSVEEFRNGAKGGKVLIYEYVPNGSLLDYFMGRKWRSLTWRQRVNIAIGAAKGIAHLHEGVNPNIIHRDIKPSNILLGDGFEAKVSDFGLVRSGPTGDQSHVSSQIKGTPGYLDPAYCSSFHLTPFSDVYSFGVILLQLVSSRPAVDSTGHRPNQHIIDWARPSLERGRVDEILDANLLTEPCNTEMMLKMGKLGLRCVVKVPKNRPTMSMVWQELEEALYSADNFISKHPSRGPRRSTGTSRRPSDIGLRRSMDYDQSQNSVSIDGIGLQRFHVDMDSISLRSTSLRCLELDDSSIIIDIENLEDIHEESVREKELNM
ncbi:probable serine/threonine-protein kinase PBL11 [Pyrus communis]|uniref:probable serine/threonine-protein kinase PBL11 n=1 Tax=Pyrus communis TaxID=23211 RepID=UPI0035C05C28